tara:strand:+ start:2750 stop:3127 length:378 start_codon:yes stop_codon:yes gene_type:complete
MIGQDKEVFLYVAEDATYAVGSQRCFKASDFIGAAATAETKTIFKFKELDTWNSTDAFDSFELTHTSDAQVEVIQTILALMSNPHGGYVVVHDFGTGEAVSFPPIKSTGTAVTLTAAPAIISTEA